MTKKNIIEILTFHSLFSTLQHERTNIKETLDNVQHHLSAQIEVSRELDSELAKIKKKITKRKAVAEEGNKFLKRRTSFQLITRCPSSDMPHLMRKTV